MPCTRSQAWSSPRRQPRRGGGSRRRRSGTRVQRSSGLWNADAGAGHSGRACGSRCNAAGGCGFPSSSAQFTRSMQTSARSRPPQPSGEAELDGAQQDDVWVQPKAALDSPCPSSKAPIVDPCNLQDCGSADFPSEEGAMISQRREYIEQRLVEDHRGALPRRAVPPVIVSGVHRCATEHAGNGAGSVRAIVRNTTPRRRRADISGMVMSKERLHAQQLQRN
mmetsp:Transcript_43566/g.91225  ORF Transcript_43566/g.91225 Transcript_43566/m.91225 type:complete len:222 (-) Transcript_43566:346-1011(-)